MTEQILLLIKEDERSGFRLLFDTYYDVLLAYCHRILDEDIVAAEDIVQDCFVSLWYNKRLVNFTGDLENFIFRMVKNRSLTHIRDRSRRIASHKEIRVVDAQDVVPESDAFFENNGEEQEIIDALYFQINRLPERCRQVFLLTYFEGKSYNEVTEELDISINTVKSHVKYALKFLRSTLKNRQILSLITLFGII